MDSNSQIFYLSLVSMTFAFLGVAIRQVCKQRCDSINCCGASIHRDTEAETKENLERIERGIEFSPRSNSNNSRTNPIV